MQPDASILGTIPQGEDLYSKKNILAKSFIETFSIIKKKEQQAVKTINTDTVKPE